MKRRILIFALVSFLLMAGISGVQAQLVDPLYYDQLNESARTNQADPTYGFPTAFFGSDPISWSFMNPWMSMTYGGFSPFMMPWGYPAGMMLGGSSSPRYGYTPTMMPWGYSPDMMFGYPQMFTEYLPYLYNGYSTSMLFGGYSPFASYYSPQLSSLPQDLEVPTSWGGTITYKFCEINIPGLGSLVLIPEHNP